MAHRPDIVFFMLDQLSARWLEAAADGACETPNIQRLRAEGVSFGNAFTSNPVCMPARATLATGLTTRQHGVLQNGYRLTPELPTFMQLLQRAGWRTGAFGKVHLLPHFAGVHPDYRPYGFDLAHTTEDPRAGEWLDWIEREHPEHYEAALATIWAADIPDLKSYGPRGEDLSARIKQIRNGFHWSTPEFPHNDAGHYTLPFPTELSQTEWITRHAEQFIRTADPGQPILAHVSYVQPHGPFCPPAQYMERADPSRIPEPAPPEWPDDPLHPRCFDAPRFGKHNRTTPEDWRRRRHYYFADIAHLDAQLGRVVDALREGGRLENTFLIFLADHGELLLDHGFRGKEEYHYDACVRVPLIVRGPGLEQGAQRPELVQLEDIFPTVLEIAELPAPQPRVMGPYLQDTPELLPGRSLLGLCGGQKPSDWREAAYVESYNSITSAGPLHWARTIRTERHRYTMYPCGGGEQLFDLEQDPHEQRNLAGDPACADLRRELRDRLMELIILQDYPHTMRDCVAHGVH